MRSAARSTETAGERRRDLDGHACAEGGRLRRRSHAPTLRDLPFRQANEVTDAAIHFKTAAARLARASWALLPGLPAALWWWRRVPVVDLVLTTAPAGDDIRRELAPGRGLPVVAVAELPARGAAYLVGRSRQALRTNRSRALAYGFRASELTDRALISAVVEESADFTPDWAVDALRWRATTGHGRFWVVFDQDGRCRALASVTVDETVARVNGVHVDRRIDGSSARFLLASAVCMDLADQHVRFLMTDRARRMSPGVNYLQDRLGYAPRRVRLRTRTTTTGG